MSDHDHSDEVLPSRGLDQSRIDESVTQAFDPAPMTWGPGADGLPTPELSASLPLSPPLKLETFVCLGDETEFVLRDRWGDVVARFPPDDVQVTDGGRWFVGLERAVSSGAPWSVIFTATDLLRRRVQVQPVRPQCRFLAQQMVDFGEDATKQMVERLCTARRDDERFFVGLRDMQVHACELREPRDRSSENRLRVFNETKIELGRLREEELGDAFDVDLALAQHRSEAIREGLSDQGIFKKEK